MFTYDSDRVAKVAKIAKVAKVAKIAKVGKVAKIAKVARQNKASQNLEILFTYDCDRVLRKVQVGLHTGLHRRRRHSRRPWVSMNVILSVSTGECSAVIGIGIGSNENDRQHETTCLK